MTADTTSAGWLAIRVLTAIAAALAWGEEPPSAPLAWSERTDADRDGRLTREEVRCPSSAEFDTDGNGSITREEATAAMAKMTPEDRAKLVRYGEATPKQVAGSPWRGGGRTR